MKDLLQRLFLFAPDEGAGGDGSTTAGTTTDTGQATGQQADDPKTFTQDDINRLMGKTRAEARQAVLNELAEKYGDFDELAKAREELEKQRQAEMSELEKLQAERQKLADQLAAKEREAQEAKLAALRLKVGQEVGLPANLASRLQGATEDELKADAEAVLAELPGLAKQPPAFRSTGAQDGASDQAHHGLTTEERAVADAAGISYEAYAAAKKRRGE